MGDLAKFTTTAISRDGAFRFAHAPYVLLTGVEEAKVIQELLA